MKASEFFPTTKGAFGMFDSVEIIPAPSKQAAHTPGPWRHESAFPTAVWAGEIWIATTNTDSISSVDVRAANARLIASAPELLEALRYAITILPEGPTKQDCQAAMRKATEGK